MDSPASPTDAAPPPSLIIPVVIASALFMENLDSTIIATALPDIARSLGESPIRLNIAVTSYLLSLAVFTPISGWVADRLGARTVFCWAIVIFTASSALCGQSHTLGMLIATRVLQGLGGAMMTPVGRLILVRTFPKDQLMRAMTYMTMPALIGPAMGPVLGGFLATYVSWRWIFYINIPFGLIGIALALRFIANAPMPPPPRFDLPGFFIAGLGLCLLELAFETLGRSTLTGSAQAGLIAAAIATLSLYRWYALRHADPVMDLRLFSIRTFRAAVLTGGLCRIGMGGIPFLLPMLFQLAFGMTALQSGLLTFVSSLGALVMKPIAPRLLRWIGFRRLLAGNAIVVGIATAALSLVTPEWPRAAIWGFLLVFGFFRSVQLTNIQALTFTDLTDNAASKGTSIAAVAQRLTMSFGVAIAASLLSIFGGPASPPTPAHFHWVFVIFGMVNALPALGFLRLKSGDGAAVSGHRQQGA
jgi:EmrB/QacA subfamily drug resistance transporter